MRRQRQTFGAAKVHSGAQGRKDPLQNAEGRARSMERLCPNVRVMLLDAGHCPFDERPDICNQELLDFIRSLSKTPAPPAELAVVD